MATHKLLLLPGDGIGPEVMGEVKRLIDWLNSAGIAKFETDTGLVGGSAYDAHKVSISEGDMAKAKEYLALPNVICVGGSWVMPADAIAGRDWGRIETLAREAAGLKQLVE